MFLAPRNETGKAMISEETRELRGWRDQSDYLMNEDVDLLQKELTARCRRK